MCVVIRLYFVLFLAVIENITFLHAGKIFEKYIYSLKGKTHSPALNSRTYSSSLSDTCLWWLVSIYSVYNACMDGSPFFRLPAFLCRSQPAHLYRVTWMSEKKDGDNENLNKKSFFFLVKKTNNLKMPWCINTTHLHRDTIHSLIHWHLFYQAYISVWVTIPFTILSVWIQSRDFPIVIGVSIIYSATV